MQVLYSVHNISRILPLYCTTNYGFIGMITSMLYEYVRQSFTIITRCLKPFHTRIRMCVFVHGNQYFLLCVVNISKIIDNPSDGKASVQKPKFVIISVAFTVAVTVSQSLYQSETEAFFHFESHLVVPFTR